MTDLSKFRFSYPIDVRFADIDALQHVNNAKYFTYMEAARSHYFQEVMGWDGRWENLTIIIARASCEFKLPLVYGDQVKVWVRTSRIGNKSFDFEYAMVRDSDGELAALGMTVQVAYSYADEATIPIPVEWRERITRYEPGLE